MSEHLNLYWISLAVCVGLLAFFNASETALVSLGKVRLRQLKERHPRLGPVVERISREPERLLSTILLGTTAVSAGASSAATAIAIAYLPEHPVLVATLGVTVVLLVFAEITPKVIAASRAERVSLLVAEPISLLSRFAAPLVNLLTLGPRLLLKAFGVTVGQPETTGDDIKTIAAIGREEGLLGDEEKEIIHSAVEFGAITVGQIMVPRVDIEGVDATLPLEEALDLAVETGHSRIPVYRGSLDQIAGVIRARDLLVAWRNRQLIVMDDLIQPAYFVPEHMKVRDLFRELRARRQGMAIVVDEYGGTAGLVTEEDVLGEIVGEMVDERGDPHAIAQRKDGTILVSGQIAVDELNAKAGLALPEEEFQTLSGLLVNHLGHVPFVGEEIALGGHLFHVLDADHRRIYRLSLRRGAVPAPAPPPFPEG